MVLETVIVSCCSSLQSIWPYGAFLCSTKQMVEEKKCMQQTLPKQKGNNQHVHQEKGEHN